MNREQMIAWLVLEGWELVYPKHPRAASSTARLRRPEGNRWRIVWRPSFIEAKWRCDVGPEPPEPDWFGEASWGDISDKAMAEIWRLANEP